MEATMTNEAIIGAIGLATALEGIRRDLGRCLTCGFVFCEDNDPRRVCLLADGPEA